MSGARTPAFEATPDGLLRWNGRAARCAFGRGGLIAPESKREGDGATPSGIWPMRQVFWRPDRVAAPKTGLPVTPLTADMGWCDDPGDARYNRPVQLPYPVSHEKLWRDDGIYDVIVVLGYNDDPVVAGKGSAIFLHIARPDFSATEGCVACSLADLIDLLKAAGPGDALRIGPPASAR
jgi:L,D-peptidoglycan transpeptidase YkuD (ErfK/YbiS/YcfS/YnhG family)